MIPIEQFHQFADLLPEALLLLTGDGTILAANQGVEEGLRIPLGELRGRRLAEVVTDAPSTLSQYLRACARSRKMVLGSLVFARKDGGQTSCRCEGAVFRPRSEETPALLLMRLIPKEAAVGRFIALNQRVSELTKEIARRKAAEAERQRGQEALRFLADASAALAAVVDHESTLRKVAHLAVPFFADWCAIDLAQTGGTVKRLTVAHVDPSKVSLAQELARRYPADPNAQRGVLHVLRTGQSELLSDIPDELLSREARDEEHLRILRALGLKSYLCVPLKVHGKILGVLSFVMAESGRRYHAHDLALAEDLAHRAAIAVENALLYQELQDADRRKNEFLATLAHELRNPLAPVRNGLQIMRLAADKPESLEQARQMMDRQLGHMVRLIDDLLDISRITRGKIELRQERVDLAAMVQSALEASRSAIEGAGHELIVTLPSQPISLYADPTRLSQVVSNILNNAARYTPQGGRIWLNIERHGEQAVVRVRDNGLGIPTDMLPRVFEMFTQVNRRLERSQGGLGIGLALVQNLVHMHGGTIEAHSAGLGQGSEFIVRLPLAQAEGEGETEPAGQARPQADLPAGRCILVVDDNVDAADSLAMLLRMLKNEVHVAHDGPSGIELARRCRPDILFLDIGLPGMSGYEVVGHLRKESELGGVTIVALTGWGQAEDRRRSQEAGFDEHLVKPVDSAALLKVLSHPARRND